MSNAFQKKRKKIKEKTKQKHVDVFFWCQRDLWVIDDDCGFKGYKPTNTNNNNGQQTNQQIN